MPRIPRIVPWTSHKEFQTVCQWLYDTDHPNQRELGVKRVRAWSSRGRLPHAVDCTASFVEVLLRDRLAARPRLSQHELRSMYSMTFVRFVNGIVDPAQQGAFAQSVAGIAERMNLPLWFVELRHASTHEQLPSLQALRSGCEQALQWLYDNYWALSLRNGIEDSDDLQRNAEAIRKIVSKYKESRKQYLKDLKARQIDLTAAKPDPALAFRALKELAAAISVNTLRSTLIPLLLDVGGLVPMKKTKRPTAPDLALSEDLLQLWTPLLHRLGETVPEFSEELVMAMLERLDVEEVFIINQRLISPVAFLAPPPNPQNDHSNLDLRKSTSYLLTLTAWLQHFLRHTDAPATRGANAKSTATASPFEDLPVDDVLEFCLKRPNVYTRSILQALVDQDTDLAQGAQPFLRFIDKMLTSKSTDRIEDVPPATDEDLEAELEVLRRRVSEVRGMIRPTPTYSPTTTTTTVSSAWSLYASPIPWTACPLGCLPDGTVPCLDLPLALDEPGDGEGMAT